MDQLGSLESRSEQLQGLFQQILDNTSAVVYVKDTEYQYLLVNHQLSDCLVYRGRSSQDRVTSICSPQTWLRFFERMTKSSLSSGEVLQCEEIAPHVDGPHSYVSVKFPLRDEFGHIIAMAGFRPTLRTGSKPGRNSMPCGISTNCCWAQWVTEFAVWTAKAG